MVLCICLVHNKNTKTKLLVILGRGRIREGEEGCRKEDQEQKEQKRVFFFFLRGNASGGGGGGNNSLIAGISAFSSDDLKEILDSLGISGPGAAADS